MFSGGRERVHWEQMGQGAGIYPSSFTNVRLWAKIEFSNVV